MLSIRVNFAEMSRSASDSHCFERAYLSFIRATKVINDLTHLYTIVLAGRKIRRKIRDHWNTCRADTDIYIFFFCNLGGVVTCRALYFCKYSRWNIDVKISETVIGDTN